MEVSLRLNELRRARGVSRQQLAQAIHVSRSAVAKRENGLGLPGEEPARLLAEYFGLTCQERFPDQGEAARLVEKNVVIARQRTVLIALSAALAVLLLAALFGAGGVIPLPSGGSPGLGLMWIAQFKYSRGLF